MTLTAWRTERGLSVAALAKLLGIDRTVVWRWEQPPSAPGHRDPPPYLRLALERLDETEWWPLSNTGTWPVSAHDETGREGQTNDNTDTLTAYCQTCRTHLTVTRANPTVFECCGEAVAVWIPSV